MLGSFVLALVTGILTPQQIYQQRAPGVVVVFASEGRVKASAGTGSIITEDGKVLTNAHVVAKEGRVLPNTWVYLRPERLRGSTRRDLTRRHAAKVLDVDHALDLALRGEYAVRPSSGLGRDTDHQRVSLRRRPHRRNLEPSP